MQPLLLESNIIDVFSEKVKENPNHIALKYKNMRYTYAQLDTITDRIATYLKLKGVRQKDVVGIYMEKSDYFIFSILGILKCGCTYLPLDKIYPLKRICNMLHNCNASWVLKSGELPLKEDDVSKCVQIDFNHMLVVTGKFEIDGNEDRKKELIENTFMNGTDLAYIIFTSGSTGEPKGIGIKHGSVLNLVNALNENIKEKQSIQHIGLLAPMVFDMSVAQMYYALLNGKTLVLIPDEVKLIPGDLLAYISNMRLDVCDITPQHLRTVMKYLTYSKNHYTLPKIMVSSGEKLPLNLAKDYFSLIGNEDKSILNSYGPSEACVYVSFYLVTKEIMESIQEMYIGKAICNTEIYIINEEGNLCKEGEIGELCIWGAGLADGYVNNYQLSEKLFVPNPFKKKEIMYRTGDLAKWSPSGNIVCLGRKDNQVKVRGYRIELEEIEHQINQVEGIEQSKVLVKRENESELLIAYYVSKKELSSDMIESFLQERLPEYMIPVYYIWQVKFELNNNGKVDVKKFPDYRTKIKMQQVKQSNSIRELDVFEKKILEICKRMLGYKDINLDDNFFNVGGDSLLIMHLCLEIDETWHVNISFHDIYSCHSIYEITLVVKQRISEAFMNDRNIFQQEVCATKVKASEFQKVVFKLEKKENRKRDKYNIHKYPAYNIVHYIRFNKNLDLERLKMAIEKEVMRQTAFRTTFINENNERYMELHDTCDDFFEVITCEQDLSVQNVKKYLREFTIDKLPLFKFFAFVHENEQVFLLNVHHAIFDFYSIHIFLRDILNLYNGEKISGDRVSFQQRLYCHENEDKEEQFEFWKNYFRQRAECALFPPDSFDKNTRIGKDDIFDNTIFSIGNNLLLKIRCICKGQQISEFILFSSVLSLVLAKYTSLKDITLGTYVPGRNREDSNVIGFFTKMVGFRFFIDYQKTFLEFIHEQNDNFKKILNNQSLLYLDIYRALEHEDLMKGELFSIVLNYVYQVSITSGDLIAIADEVGEEPEQFPIGIKAIDTKKEVIFQLKYAKRLYSKEYIQAICEDIIEYATILVESFESNMSLGVILDKGPK